MFRVLKPTLIIVWLPILLLLISLTNYLYWGTLRTNSQAAGTFRNINSISKLWETQSSKFTGRLQDGNTLELSPSVLNFNGKDGNVAKMTSLAFEFIGEDKKSPKMALPTFELNEQDQVTPQMVSERARTQTDSSGSEESFKNNIHKKLELQTKLDDSRVKLLDKRNTRMLNQVTRRQRYLIYLCGGRFKRCGGWADRFKGIVITYLISKATNRTFGIDMTHPPCDLARYLQPNQIAWNINITNTILKSYKNSVGYYKETGQIYFYNSINNMDFGQYFKEDIVYFQANFDYVDAFKNNTRYISENVLIANLTRDQVYAKVYNELFSLAPDIQSDLFVFMKLAKPTPTHQLVCSQIRMGRNPTNPKDRANISSLDDISKVWDFLNKYKAPDKYRIYVASDSDEIMKEAHARFPNVLVDNGGQIFHIDKFSNSSSVCEGVRKVIYDQHILMKCDILLLTFSGLGRMAAYLRQKDSGLYCLVKHNIVSCNHRTLKELYQVKG